MLRPVVIRTVVLILFLVIDAFLLAALLQQNYPHSAAAQKTRSALSVFKETPLSFLLSEPLEKIAYSPEVTLSSDEILIGLNQERATRKLSSLELDPDLNDSAASLLSQLAANDFDTDIIDSDSIIKGELSKVKNIEGVLYFDTMIGPRNTDATLQYWSSNTEHAETISIPELSGVGIATASATVDGELVGVVVSIFFKPQTMTTTPVQSRQDRAQAQVFPTITNQSVLDALNEYRKAHGISQLQEHPMLCAYAEKRVRDLIAFQGLDGHEGFKKDFADPENLPEEIKEYPGSTIGENLAYQNCINMRTNQSFTAPTATALIEWCFDSSTKGHREAQLNAAYKNACSRNQNGYFVILFGE